MAIEDGVEDMVIFFSDKLCIQIFVTLMDLKCVFKLMKYIGWGHRSEYRFYNIKCLEKFL